ncbi:ComEC family competence protein [Roseivivax sp. GX 12232]|uniref:ComEC/Rec2 family competence protein n=1 Tax=Roseivivax sp. GX 12232 TaxID=2900547 RepID=UPI001E37BE81|nr:ComEC/Rec2 family competence protein [Roseivivax sp. GX 12232]MCE0506479.1 ComEC family competence protein [Roseivivax sp. GX 12232]
MGRIGGSVADFLADLLARQAGAFFAWGVAALAAGIGLYFALRVEPPLWALAALWALGLAGLGVALRVALVPRALICALVLPALGLALAGSRAHLVAGPVIEGRYYGPIEGRIVQIDRSASDKLRLTLDGVVLPWHAPEALPRRVRVSLHGAQGWFAPRPGQRVILTGHLSAPGGPVEPGGFDFRRHAWFQGVGGVGYTRSPVLLLAPPEPGASTLGALRHRVSARLQAGLPGPAGAVAAAILTGDRSAIPRAVTRDLRQANLAHLLAISGLHMGLLTGLVFAVVRLGLVALPGVGQTWPVKKIAALAGLGAGAGYLALSGANVATERAFVMVAIMCLAVLFDRRALSLRSVALAALVILVTRPEALLSPGFQMSFAATGALVAAFAAWRDSGIERRLPRLARGPAALVLSSLVAGGATAPIAMAHFNILAHYGLLANLLAVPLMGLWVMPLGLLALGMMPFGLEALPLRAMGWGLDWILGVAARVAGLPGALGQIRAPPEMVLPLITLAFLLVLLTLGRLRLLALAPAALAALLWSGAERPWLLIDRQGVLVGQMTQRGRALSRPAGAGFAARLWLENDGDAADQPRAAARWPAATRVTHLGDRQALAGFTGCKKGEILVSRYPLETTPSCRAYTPESLALTGPVALYRDSADTEAPLREVTAAARSGPRLWVQGAPAPRERLAGLTARWFNRSGSARPDGPEP